MDPVLDWLMEGDPAIRWQVQHDLLAAPEQEWRAEQQRTLAEGWGARFLALQDPQGSWGGGIYSPKWVSTTYTLLTLCNIGIPADCTPAQCGAELMLASLLGPVRDDHFIQRLADLDRCIVGMILQVAVYFGIDDERIPAILDNLLAERMPDGGWNCRRLRDPHVHHSSFHTTLNVLDGLRMVIERGVGYRREEVLAAEQNALDLLLQHRLYRSDKTGEAINPKFTMLSFPYRWHFDILRGLDYFARCSAPRDERLADAVALLGHKRRSDGCWPVQQKYPGRVFFDMEPTGGPSRWNTLRALRVLRWWAEVG